MKKVLAITCVLILCVVSSVLAGEDNWRFLLKADNGAGQAYGADCHAGVFSGSNVADYGTVIGQNVAWVVVGVGDTTYSRYGQPKTNPVWRLYVAAQGQYEYTSIRLRLATTSTATVLPPDNVGGVTCWYELTMVNNRGKAGAPANGTVWKYTGPFSVSQDPVGSTITLPVIKGTIDHSWMMANGYVFDFAQVVPEPSSLMALGAGLMGLVGFVARRRKA